MLEKRSIMLGLSILIALALVACGGRSQSQPTPTAEAPAAEATAAPEATEIEESPTAEVAESEVVTEEVAAEGSSESASLITVESETFVGDIIDDNNPALVTLSTDGSMLVWPEVEGHLWNQEEGLCTYLFDTAAKSCSDVPDTFDGYPYAFFSSPDSSTFAFTEDPVQQGNESDIWVFDVTAATFTNLTDDGVQGNWMSANSSDYTLDYLPMWSPEGELYFWRSVPVEVPITYTLQLMRITATGGEPELVRDLSQDLAGNLLYFNDEAWFMDGVSALSPDGTQIAVVLTNVEDPDSIPANGIWIIDLNDPSAAPRQIADHTALQAGQPAWSAENFPLVPVGLSWTGDSSSVVVTTFNQDDQVPLFVLYEINVASGEVTPVVNFSDVADEKAYMNEAVTDNGGVGLPMRVYSPWTASLSPDNNIVLMYQNIGEFTGLIVSPLPPASTLPATGYQSQIMNSVSTVRSSRGTDGKVLISNVLFVTSQSE